MEYITDILAEWQKKGETEISGDLHGEETVYISIEDLLALEELVNVKGYEENDILYDECGAEIGRRSKR